MTGSKNSRNTFRRIYLTVLIAALAALCIFLVITGLKLKAYEEAQPKHMAEDIFTSDFKNSSAAGIAELLYTDTMTDTDRAALVSEVTETLKSGELTCTKISSVTQEDCEKYLVKAGDTNLASFVLKKVPGSEKTVLFSVLSLGYAEYKLDSITNEIEGSTYITPPDVQEPEITVSAPSDYTVAVDGVVLSEQNITERDIPMDGILYTPDGFTLPTLTRYKPDSNSKELTVTATAPDGTQCTAQFDEATNTYVCPYIYAGDLQTLYGQTILEGAKLYEGYLQGDSAFFILSYYLDVSSSFYQQLRNTVPSPAIAHTGADYSDEGTYEYIRWSDEIFSCRVRFNEQLHQIGQPDYTQTVDRTFFFKIRGTDVLMFGAYDMN